MNDYSLTMSLRIRHPTKSCKELSSALNLTPKIAHDAGENRVTPKGNILNGKYLESYCSFELEEKKIGEVELYIRKWYLEFSKQSELFRLIKDEGGRSELFIGIFLSGNSGIELISADFKELSNIGLDLSFDLFD